MVLQGGGSRGAYQVGVLKAIAEITGSSGNPFPMISGTSVGAINASSIASHAEGFDRAARHLETLWRGLNTQSVFDARFSSLASTVWRIVRTFWFGGKTNRYGWLDNRPLRQLLETEFKREGVQAAYESGALQSLCITASCYTCGVAVTYFEGTNDTQPWNRARREGKADTIRVDHLMASSALPFIFPAVRIDQTYLGDGALRLTAPLSPIIRMGADKAVVIGVRDPEITIPGADEEPVYPSFGEMSGHALDILFNDNLDADIERVRRINRLLGHMTQAEREASGMRHFELLTILPSQDLRKVAKRFEYEMPKTIRFILKAIGAWGTDGRLPSYLLFEPGYIGALIDLGYNDTLARADEVRAFLSK